MCFSTRILQCLQLQRPGHCSGVAVADCSLRWMPVGRLSQRSSWPRSGGSGGSASCKARNSQDKGTGPLPILPPVRREMRALEEGSLHHPSPGCQQRGSARLRQHIFNDASDAMHHSSSPGEYAWLSIAEKHNKCCQVTLECLLRGRWKASGLAKARRRRRVGLSAVTTIRRRRLPSTKMWKSWQVPNFEQKTLSDSILPSPALRCAAHATASVLPRLGCAPREPRTGHLRVQPFCPGPAGKQRGQSEFGSSNNNNSSNNENNRNKIELGHQSSEAAEASLQSPTSSCNWPPTAMLCTSGNDQGKPRAIHFAPLFLLACRRQN